MAAQLASKSPFLPPQPSGGAAPTAGAPLEFRGTMETPDGGKQVRIVDPARKSGAWLKVGERDATLDVTVKQYDEAHDTVTLEHEGKPLTLAEHVARVASAGVAQQMPMPMPAPNAPPMPAAVTNSVVLNPTPAQEQARLEAVAAEVARRRALREQAAQQINQGVQPQITVPQPQAQPPRSYPAQPQPLQNPQRMRTQR